MFRRRDPDKKPNPPETLFQWIEFLWLCVFSRQFRATRRKRKLYYDRCMIKSFRSLP